MKDRNISNYDFLQALQKEYVCLEIRSKIYTYPKNKEYFKRLMTKKAEAIIVLANRNSLKNILEHRDQYIKVWKSIVPEYGYPNFIYNIKQTSERDATYPFIGTVVKTNNIIGVCKGFVGLAFSSYLKIVESDGTEHEVHIKQVERLDYQQTDKYFYYYPGTQFKIKGYNEVGVFEKSNWYENSNTALLTIDGMIQVSVDLENISRII